MKNKYISMEKISLLEKLKLCWFTLFNGDVLLKKYCEDRGVCKQREKDLLKCVRPRSNPTITGKCGHTDYYEP